MLMKMIDFVPNSIGDASPDGASRLFKSNPLLTSSKTIGECSINISERVNTDRKHMPADMNHSALRSDVVLAIPTDQTNPSTCAVYG